MKFDNSEYSENLDWLFNQLPMFSRIGAAAYKPGLKRTLNLADYYGHPERKFKSIHVAGTNGKGSVSNMLSAVLQAQGYKTALYTSPHLVDFRERMRINGNMIPKKYVIDFIKQWRNKISEWTDNPSFFELTMMMAFDWFAHENVDYAIIEVGMGGRLDSTNIITPILSIITNISYDHTQFLGSTLSQIAVEKAGIIKSGIPVIIGEADKDVENVFREHADMLRSPIREAYNKNIPLDDILPISELKGDYQSKNLRTVLCALRELKNLGVDISDESIKAGLSNVSKYTGFRGRWDIINHAPLTICDTGHNEAGLSYNISQLKDLVKNKPSSTLRFVIGFVADKDIDNIMKIFPDNAVYYLTQAQIPRALPKEKLKEKADEFNWNSRIYNNVMEAYQEVCKESGPDDIIYIGGSTFIVADLYKFLDFVDN